ncbi:long tail fiber protein distal subunit [Morganella phage vB_MmoM_MP1]|uniref:Long tail fiber distal subunit n=1 Tax=Morganella phage vB_MmoM_MP1 TaxID=1852628 RepID=A0A192YA64_9CAUD|nr:long tail fiber protein distal subunit [Morganella phage vB_MmoM_MP1]ANM46408.1 long tail fiber distal subunit [Morganella phage vB_MmoM_MP1]
MADLTRIQFKRSKTPNVRPAPDTVAEGEIILNLADRAILTKLGNEIIDLGFAKGGKVDGNIDLNGNFDQKNGNITTTGNLTVNGKSNLNSLTITEIGDYSGIDIKHGDKYLRLQNMPIGLSEFASISKRDADGTQTSSFKIPIGIGTAATQEWTNSLIKSNGFSTIVRNPNGTDRLCIVANNSGEAGAYDYANNRWAFVHNQASMEIYGAATITASAASPDYANIRLKKGDGRYVQIETKPHAGSSDMLAFVYKQADGTNQHVITLPYDNGTLSTREWTNTMIKDLGNGVGVASPRGTTEIANNDDGNMGFWDKTTKRWLFVVHPESTNLSTIGLNIRNRTPNGDQSRIELASPNNANKIGLWTYNDGRNLLSAYNNGSWTNIQISDTGFDVPVSLRLTGGDYAGLQMMRSDGTYTRIEQNPMSAGYLLTFIGRDASGRNQHVLSMPRVTGTLATEDYVGSRGFATQSWVNSQGFSKGTPELRFNNVRNIASTGGSDHGSGSGAYSLTTFGESMEGYMLATRQTNAAGQWTEWTGYALYKSGHAYYENSTTLKFSGGRGIRFQARIAY